MSLLSSTGVSMFLPPGTEAGAVWRCRRGNWREGRRRRRYRSSHCWRVCSKIFSTSCFGIMYVVKAFIVILFVNINSVTKGSMLHSTVLWCNNNNNNNLLHCCWLGDRKGVYAKFRYNRLRIDKALGNFGKSDNNNKNNILSFWGPFPCPKWLRVNISWMHILICFMTV